MRKPKIAPAQLAYIAAKAQVEVLTDEYNAAMQPHEPVDLASETDVAHYVKVSIDTQDKIGLSAAFDALHKAEDALLEWGHTRVSTCPTTRAQYAARANELDALFANAIGWKSYKARTSLIDITMKLQV